MNYFFRYIFLFLLVSSSVFAQGTWKRLQSPTNKDLKHLFFIDSLKGWVAGDSGAIFKTTDGCRTWQNQSIQTVEQIRDIFFLNDSLGWAVNWYFDNPIGSVIHLTLNGGNNWEMIKLDYDLVFLRTIYFLDSLNGFTAGDPYGIYRTQDGGYNWSPASIDSGSFTQFPNLDFAFTSPKNGFACGGFMDMIGTILQTTNYGLNWHAYGVSNEPLQKLYMFDSSKIWAVGGDFEFGAGIVRTSNAGLSWEYESLQSFGMATAISFRTPAEVWCPLGFSAILINSVDSGRTWREYFSPDSAGIYDLIFTDSLHGYAVGDKGYIYNYVPKISSAKNEFHQLAGKNFFLFQNFPNPFNPSTTIKFSVNSRQKVTIALYDILGNQAALLLNEEKPAGTYEINFSANNYNLPSGIYFCRMISGNSTQMRKFILLK